MSASTPNPRHDPEKLLHGKSYVDREWHRLETLFLAALEISPEERTAWLDGECAGNAELRAELEAMLRAHDGEELNIETRFLSESVASSMLGERVGPYRFLALIGRGGMGEVYLAERADRLYERRVAVKLVQYGPRAALRERFARERAILARLIHPKVATLYDGGMLDDGRPYLVMEYVDGVPITEYCDSRSLDLRARIDLFLDVCEAVQFAHGALVIHRDLKPSNILVDADGGVKLLDFGIAKLLEEEEDTAQPTSILDRVLTPEHAAPEQIRGEDPTTATDVYGLGVLLCELLVGERPLRFPTRSPAEIDRIAREVEALPPSRLLGRMESDAAARCARLRRTTVDRLHRALRGDLDAICARTLRKESDRRYPSVAELMADLRRHLNSRPVRAVQGTRVYTARKFLVRHRTSLTLSAVAFVVLAAFLALALLQSRQVRTERDRAQREFERADLVLDRLVGLFESTQPGVLGDPDLLDVGEFLRRGEETAALLEEDPETRRRMYETLAEIYSARGGLDRAIELAEQSRSLAEDPRDRLRLGHAYALLRARRDGPQVGAPLLRASLEDHRELLGREHLDTAQAMQDLAFHEPDREEKRRLLEGAFRIKDARLSSDDPARASILNALAILEMEDSRYEEAESLFEEADALLERGGPERESERITVRHNLASVYARRGDWERAEPIQREIVAIHRERHGEDSDMLANALEAHAVSLANLGRHRESGEAFAQALAIFERTLDPHHWRIANCTRNVGQLLALQGRYQEALPFLERSVQIKLSQEAGGHGDPYVEGQRAMVYLGLGELERARSDLRAIAAWLDDPGSGRAGVYAGDARAWLGIAELVAGDEPAARAAFTRSLELRRKVLGDEHPKTAEAVCGLGLAGGEVPGAEMRSAVERYHAWGLAHPLMLSLLDASAP